MNYSIVITAIQGVITGLAMMVPGVSGGTVAMILGAYDNLIASVSSFSKHRKKSTIFLLAFSIPSLVGIVLFSKPLLAFIESNRMIAMYFFMGAVLGSVPMIYREARVKKIDIRFFIYIAIGVALVSAIRFIPKDVFHDNAGDFNMFLIVQIIAGLLVAVALVLPGISVTYMLVVMGIYESTMTAIGNIDIIAIFPLAVTSLVGVVLIAKALEYCMKSHPFRTYLIILGFILGSLLEVFPGVPQGNMIIKSIMVLASGFIIIFLVTLKTKR